MSGFMQIKREKRERVPTIRRHCEMVLLFSAPPASAPLPDTRMPSEIHSFLNRSKGVIGCQLSSGSGPDSGSNLPTHPNRTKSCRVQSAAHSKPGPFVNHEIYAATNLQSSSQAWSIACRQRPAGSLPAVSGLMADERPACEKTICCATPPELPPAGVEKTHRRRWTLQRLLWRTDLVDEPARLCRY